MRIRAHFFCLSQVLILGCAAPPPTVTRVVAHQTAAIQGGTLVLLDVCVNFSPLASQDYFVLRNARQGANAIAAEARQFLDAAGLHNRTVSIPFICGALHDLPDAKKRVAEEVDAPISERAQPLWVAPELASDPEYLSALQSLATYCFRKGITEFGNRSSAATGSNLPDTVDEEKVGLAAAMVKQKSGHTSLLYVGITGNSISSQKLVALGAVVAASNLAFQAAVGPIYTTSYDKTYVVFYPGGMKDSRQMAAGLFDLNQAKLVRSRIVSGIGDPMKPEVLAERSGLNLLLRETLLISAP